MASEHSTRKRLTDSLRRPARAHAIIPGAVVAFAVAVAGCGSGREGETGSAAPQGSWQLAAGTGPEGAIDAVDGHRITLVLEDDQVSGTAACNSYGATARIDGDRFELRSMSQTEMGCEPDAMAAEAAYLDALQRADRARLDGNRLVLSGPSVELQFEPLPPVPSEALAGTTWELETLIAGELASTRFAPATLRLDRDRSIGGQTGCRGFSGRYVVGGDEIRITHLSTHDGPSAGACPAEAAEQDRIVVDVLGDGFRAELDGDRLTLISSGGYGLIYRSR